MSKLINYIVLIIIFTLTNFLPSHAVTGNLILSRSSISENQKINTRIGSVSVEDGDFDEDEYEYEIIEGDKKAFKLINFFGGTLRSNKVFDYETKSQYQITIRATAPNSDVLEETFTIIVFDLIEDGTNSYYFKINDVDEKDILAFAMTARSFASIAFCRERISPEPLRLRIISEDPKLIRFTKRLNFSNSGNTARVRKNLNTYRRASNLTIKANDDCRGLFMISGKNNPNNASVKVIDRNSKEELGRFTI